MWEYLFGDASFLPHGFCLIWNADLIALHTLSNAAIGLSYYSIPLAILTFLRKRPDFEYRWVAHLFAAFILWCGTTHFLDIMMLWYPWYGLDGIARVITALVSMTTAALLWPLLPKIIALPSPQQLREANDQMRQEIGERCAAEEALRDAQSGLERRVAERTAELARSEERARLAAEAGDIGTWDWDLTTNTVTRSLPHQEIFGHALDEDSTPEAFFRRLHPDDRARVENEMQVALAQGAWRSEFRVLLPDGRLRWLDGRGSVIYDERAGVRRPLRFIGTVIDITHRIEADAALKASIAEKETLLKEVHHRVKNNLQGLLALMMIEEQQLTDPVAKERFEALRLRVTAMADIHQNLYLSDNLAEINFGAQLRQLCTNIWHLSPIAARVDLDVAAADLCCDLDMAVPLAMLANEIVTNALKHAFPGERAGRITVTFRREPDGAVTLMVADDGIGDTGTNPPGLGKQLKQRLVRQLDATLTRTVDAGTRVAVRLPGGRFQEGGS